MVISFGLYVRVLESRIFELSSIYLAIPPTYFTRQKRGMEDNEGASSSRIPSLDGLRALAVTLVLFAHGLNGKSFPKIQKTDFGYYLSGLGTLGVTIFFVISGYLITLLLLHEFQKFGRIDLRAFYVRRILRIFPVFYLYIVSLSLLASITEYSIPAEDYRHALTFTANYKVLNWMLGHLWSLSVEEQFYLFWPLIVACGRRHIFSVATALICLAPVARVVAYKFPEIAPYVLAPSLANADVLMFGAVLANFTFLRSPILSRPVLHSWRIRILCLVLMCIFPFLATRGIAGKISLPFERTITGLCAACLIHSVTQVRDDFLYRLLNNRFVNYIGVLSFSIYIWQQMFLTIQDRPAIEGWWTAFPVNIVLVFFVSAISYHAWEKPFLRLKALFSAIPKNLPVQDERTAVTHQE